MKNNWVIISIFCTLMLWMILSCSKNEVTPSFGDCEVTVSVNDITFESPSNSGSKSSLTDTQIKHIKLQDGSQLIAKLDRTDIQPSSLRASSALKATSVNKIDKGVKYRILIYDKNGNFKETKVYTVGSESSEGSFKLDGGVEYKFVAISYGNTTTPSAPSTTSKISTDVITSLGLTNTLNHALLYANVSFTPKSGANNLNLVLKNLLSEVILNVNTSSIGPIAGVTASLSGHYATINNIKMLDGTFTTSPSAQSRSFVFPPVNVSSVSSSPNIICNGSNPLSTFKATVTVGTASRTVTINGFEILPGYRYLLNLSFIPSGIIIGTRVWAKGNLSYLNGVYYNRSNPEETGYDYSATDYWNYASPEIPLLPAMNTTLLAESPAIVFPVNDPCTKIAGGNWRMPTLADFEALGAPVVVDAKGVEGGVFTGVQANGVGNTTNGTKAEAGYLYFTGKDEVSNTTIKLKFFAGGGLRGVVRNNIPLSEPGVSTFRNFDAVYHAIDSQNPTPATNRDGVPAALQTYLYAPPIFLALNENSSKQFNFLSHRFVHTGPDQSEQWARRDSRFPIRCVKDL
ncbi:hypothetical protein [Sphingobacterium zhuxiongii]|nr:hypothetical protein [Sphingobacterium sp. dk4302]